MTASTQTLLLGMAGLVATLISSALGLYFTARARAAPMRQHLYEKQLALMLRVIELIGRIRVFAPMVLEKDGPHVERALGDLRVKVHELSEASDSAAALLPTELYIEVNRLSRVVAQFLTDYDAGKDTSWFPDDLAGRAAKTALLSRVFLGVDELSDESAKLFGGQGGISKVGKLAPADIVRSVKKDNASDARAT